VINWICGLLATVALIASPVAHANDYPSKPITLIVPYAPGSGMDAMSRLIGQGLSDRLKQPVLIDNKAGAKWDARNGRSGARRAGRVHAGHGQLRHACLQPELNEGGALRFDQ
jgi:tripartite-type tricarboxylate transporter receptor subunit TctC